MSSRTERKERKERKRRERQGCPVYTEPYQCISGRLPKQNDPARLQEREGLVDRKICYSGYPRLCQMPDGNYCCERSQVAEGEPFRKPIRRPRRHRSERPGSPSEAQIASYFSSLPSTDIISGSNTLPEEPNLRESIPQMEDILFPSSHNYSQQELDLANALHESRLEQIKREWLKKEEEKEEEKLLSLIAAGYFDQPVSSLISSSPSLSTFPEDIPPPLLPLPLPSPLPSPISDSEKKSRMRDYYAAKFPTRNTTRQPSL